MRSVHGRRSVVTAPASGNRAGAGTIAAAFAALWWALDLAVLRGGTPHPLDDTWEYGLVARSLLAGHGFRTTMLHPPLWALRDAAGTVPSLVHGPLLSVIGAPFVAWLGPAAIDRAAWLAAAFAIVAAAFTARAVARGAGVLTGVCAGALVTLSPMLLRMVHHDVAPAAGAAAVAVALDQIARPRPRAFAAGLALGLGALARPELLAAAPFAALYLGRSALAPLALGVLLPVAPWAVRTASIAGAPASSLSAWLLLAYTRSHPGLSPLWDFALPPARFPAALLAALPELPAKWLHLAPRAVKHALLAPAPGLGLLAALGLAAAFGAGHAGGARRRAWAALGAALVPVALVTLTESSERYVAAFVPLWAMGVIMAMCGLAGPRGPAARWRWIVVPVALALPFALAALLAGMHESAALRAWLRQERASLATRAEPARGGLAFSDTPDFVAWTTGRPVVAVTLDGYHALPPSGMHDPARPARGDSTDTWFHADLRALPAPSHGGAADALPAR